MGLKGLAIEITRKAPYRPLAGLRGLVIILDSNLPVRVVDKRGQGLANARVTVTNPTSGVPSEGFTDENGNILLHTDGTNPNPVNVSKEKAFATKNYTVGNSFTIELDPPLLR